MLHLKNKFKIGEFLARNSWFFVGFLILFFVILVNLFPRNHVIVGGDTSQLINISERGFAYYFYDWQGRVSIFYSIFFLLDKIGISETGQLSWYLGLFIFGSYISFYIFVKIIFEKINIFLPFITSLFYALNLYTLYIFTYSWGYSGHQILYIFIPLLTGLYLKFLKSEKNIYGAYFIIVLFLASSSFANPAFALSLAIFLILITCIAFIFKYFTFSVKLVSRLLIFGILSFLVCAYWIFPLIPQVKKGIADLYSNNILDLDWWLQKSSTPLQNTLSLLPYDMNNYFPYNFPYRGMVFLKNLLVVLSFLPFILVIFSLKQRKIAKHTSVFWTFFVMLLLFIPLVARVRFPFEKINNFIFHLSGFNTLRSYEKIAIFIPFLFTVLLLTFIIQSETKKYYKSAVVLLVVILFIPLPFYFGKLQQNISSIFSAEKNKNYQKANRSFLIKIPKEYYEIKPRINNDPDDAKIAILPFNVINGVGWSNYIKWNLLGADITRFLYNKKFIDANSPYINNWFFAKEFNDLDYNPEWIIKLLGMLNVKYIIYHKDVDEKFVERSIDKMEYLLNKGIIIKIEENDFFSLFEINKKYQFSHVSLQKSNITFLPSPISVEYVFDILKRESQVANYITVNPKKIIVSVDEYNESGYIVLNEPYDKNWKAFYKKGRNTYELESVGEINYTNRWLINKDIKDSEVIIEYLPMKLFWMGVIISASVLILIISYILYYLTYARNIIKKS